MNQILLLAIPVGDTYNKNHYYNKNKENGDKPFLPFLYNNKMNYIFKNEIKTDPDKLSG